MVPTEQKLFRIFITSGSEEGPFDTKLALGRAVAEQKYSEFKYARKGKDEYSYPESIVPYITICQEVGILDQKLKPFAETQDAFLDGFILAARDKVMNYCRRFGFSKRGLSRKVRELLNKKPPQLPSLDNIYDELDPKPTLGKTNFKRLLRMNMVKEELKLDIKLMPILLIDGVVGGKKAS